MPRKLSILEMERLSPEEYGLSPKLPIVVALDNVRSMNNVGSLFRTADALRIQGLCLCGITATPPHADIHKTALGAEEVVSWSHYASTVECVEAYRSQGYEVWCIEQAEGSVMLDAFAAHDPSPRKLLLVVGNEVKGVQQEVIDASHGCIEIRQWGTKHSLNVSVAAGIVLWQVAQLFPHP